MRAGFYLSGCSRLYASTGDQQFLDRVNHVLDELEACQNAYGPFMKTRWRDSANGWFSYQMKTLPDQPMDLICSYWGEEQGSREFEIVVNDTVIATEKLGASHPGRFYNQVYPVPPELTHARQQIEVRFRAKPGNTAGGLFGLRIVKQAKP